MMNLLSFYAKNLEASNTDPCPRENARRLRGTLHFLCGYNPNRPNIPIEVPQHGPDNFDNTDKKHFYRLWSKLDFDGGAWVDSFV
jgi:hypothetical protein